jgi:hypothetical protein
MVSPTGVNQLANKIAEQGLKEGPKEGLGKPPEVNPNDLAHFQNALQNNPGNNPGNNPSNNPGINPGSQTSQSLASAQNMPPVGAIQKPESPTMGDKILKGMDQMRTDVQKVGDINMNGMSPQNAMQAQMQLFRATASVQATSQVVSKVEQDADTLLKSQ